MSLQQTQAQKGQQTISDQATLAFHVVTTDDLGTQGHVKVTKGHAGKTLPYYVKIALSIFNVTLLSLICKRIL